MTFMEHNVYFTLANNVFENGWQMEGDALGMKSVWNVLKADPIWILPFYEIFSCDYSRIFCHTPRQTAAVYSFGCV